MKSYLYILLAMIFIFSCKTEKKEKTLYEKRKDLQNGELSADNVYHVDVIGWTTTIPAGWEIVTQQEMGKIKKKGADAFEEVFETDIDYSDVQDLLSVKKDIINSFMSNMQKVNDTLDGNFDERIKTVYDAIRTTYASKDIKMEEVVGAIRIDGIMFDRLEIKILSPDKKKTILNQEIFIAPINGYDFTMIINYNNEKDKDDLLEMVMGSKFSMKD
ncbi:MAG TPA: hypothetical protein PK275_06800 [Chitinophagaceae bacterium]|jgi:hypothetical protein|nr:hypothetical protein [Ferruginibacter sp.]HUM97546.1 hypothetical protein [Chitinophagaceae bacterium]